MSMKIEVGSLKPQGLGAPLLSSSGAPFATGTTLESRGAFDPQPLRKPPRAGPCFFAHHRRPLPDHQSPSVRLPRQITRPEEHVLPFLVSPQPALFVLTQQLCSAVTCHRSSLVCIQHRLVVRGQHVLEVRDELFAHLRTTHQRTELLPLGAPSGPLGVKLFACHRPPPLLMVEK